MDFPVQNIVEQAVKIQTNSLVGTDDVNLNTIVKMSLMDMDDELIKEVLTKIRHTNQVEQYWVEKEYELTYDIHGNVVPTLSIHNTYETQKDSIRLDDEPEGSKAKPE